MATKVGRPSLDGGKGVKLTVLLEPEMMEHLDALCATLRQQWPGGRMDRSTAVRYLLSKALAQSAAEHAKAPEAPGKDQRPARKGAGHAA